MNKYIFKCFNFKITITIKIPKQNNNKHNYTNDENSFKAYIYTLQFI